MLYVLGMRRIIILTALALSLPSAAFADRWHGGGHASTVVRDHRGGWGGGVAVRPSYRYNTGGHYYGGYGGYGGYRGSYYRPAYYGRRPIYVQAPYIRHHYYDYRYRPELVVESYPPMAGYIWVAGSWQWNGYEWIWQPGHYQPDPNYYYDGY